MKQILSKIGYVAIIAVVCASCHKLNVEVTTELTPETYPKTEAQYNSVMGPVYISLRGEYSGGYFSLQSMSTDESVLATFGADWIDGNRYLELHKHTWTKDNPSVGGSWFGHSNMIGLCNQTIFIIGQSPEGATKNTSLAELKTMRAFTYFQMMDLFGNVPLDTTYGSLE